MFLFQEALHKCQHDRNVLIDVIARVDSPEAQRIVLKVMKGNEESEVQRCLFHLTASTEPIKVNGKLSMHITAGLLLYTLSLACYNCK